jgi:membrane protein DedA with SNARE-associated domain
MDALFHWISEFGYPALFSLLMLGIVGLPIPDETLLAFAGYLVFKNELSLLPTVGTAFLGSSCGITVSYVIGRSLGLYIVHKAGTAVRIRAADLDRVKSWYSRWGKYTLIFGYYIPGIRHVVALVAGSSKLPMLTFAPFAYLGALIWSTTFLSLGYTLGDAWEQESATVHQFLALAAGVSFFSFVGFIIYRIRKGRL